MLLTVSLCHLRVALCNFLPRSALKLYTKYQMFVPSEHDKWDIILQGGTAIAYEVFQNLPQMHNADGRCFWQHFSVIYRSHQFHINQHWLSNCTQNARFGVASEHGKWDAVLQVKTSIAAEGFHILPLMYKVGGRSFWKHQSAKYVSHCVISVKVDCKIAHKIPDLGYHLSTWNGMLSCKESDSLLLECFIALIRCHK